MRSSGLRRAGPDGFRDLPFLRARDLSGDVIGIEPADFHYLRRPHLGLAAGLREKKYFDVCTYSANRV